MGRRIRWLGIVLVVCFAAVVAQLVNLQMREASALDASTKNPRNAIANLDNYRGNILAADGSTVLAKSVPNPPSKTGGKKYYRTYPGGFLYSGIVGYDSLFYGAAAGVENVYNTQLSLHAQSAKTLGQLLQPPPKTADDVTLTIQPTLMQAAYHAVSTIRGPNQDAAIEVMNPKTGAILAQYSNPSFDPNALAQPTVAKEQAAHKADYTTKDAETFVPGEPMATFDRFPPGSTYKVVTTAAVYNLKPTLASFTWGPGKCTGKGAIPGTKTTFKICNDAGTATNASACGGTIRVMLPESCDPGYVMLGLAVGGTAMAKQADLLGVNSTPPVDLTGVNPSHSPSAAQFTTAPKAGYVGRGGLALAAFGQGTVSLTALQNVMNASAVANTGAEMTPHVMSQIRNAQGGLVEQYEPKLYKQAMSAQAAQKVKTLMYLVANTSIGTAYGVFPRTEQVAAKTGTAQITTTPNTRSKAFIDDWMIAFAPATNPTVAVAVVVPHQGLSTYGATTAGPLAQQMIAATLAEQRAHGVTPSTSPITTTPLPTTTTTTTAQAAVAPVGTTTTTTSTTTTVPSSTTTTTTTTPTPTTTTTTAAAPSPAASSAVTGASPATAGAAPSARVTAASRPPRHAGSSP
ncbi:MAG: penicillin-binding transpeptidase domain-containing protein [Acidimicrobiales bacterium]